MDALGCYTADGANWLTCAINDLAVATRGQAIFGLIVAGALILSFYLASNGGMATPSVVTALFGGLMIAVLPTGLHSLAITIMFIGLVAAILAALNRYVMSPGI